MRRGRGHNLRTQEKNYRERVSLTPRGERASGREDGFAPLAFDTGKDRELPNLTQWRSLSTLLGDVLLDLSVGLDWTHPSLFMSFFTVCTPTVHILVYQEDLLWTHDSFPLSLTQIQIIVVHLNINEKFQRAQGPLVCSSILLLLSSSR